VACRLPERAYAEARKGGHEARPGEGHITSDDAIASKGPAVRVGCDSQSAKVSAAESVASPGSRDRPNSDIGGEFPSEVAEMGSG
jgi:hypothetical protein